MPRIRALVLAASLTIAVVFGSSPHASAVERTSDFSQPAATPQVALVTWVPWDGNQITSLANCERRRQYISATFDIKLSDLRCDRIDIGIPPCPVYRWILMVNADAFAARSVPAVRPVVQPTRTLC